MKKKEKITARKTAPGSNNGIVSITIDVMSTSCVRRGASTTVAAGGTLAARSIRSVDVTRPKEKKKREKKMRKRDELFSYAHLADMCVRGKNNNKIWNRRVLYVKRTGIQNVLCATSLQAIFNIEIETAANPSDCSQSRENTRERAPDLVRSCILPYFSSPRIRSGLQSFIGMLKQSVNGRSH